MKKSVLYITLIISVLSFNLYSQVTKENASEQYEEENIAIYTFTDAGNRFQKEGERITELITDVFVNLKRFNIVDRQNLDKYLKEMELQLAGLTENNVVEMGKIYGYNKAVFGSVINVSTYNKYSEDGTTVVANIEIVLKIVDVSTTKILYSSIIKGSGSANAILGYSQAVNSAMQDAYDSLISNIKYSIRNIFKITLTVYDRQGSNVMLLTGLEQGVTKGFRFKIYGYDKPITTSTGQIIEQRYKYKGSVRITSAGNEYSIAKIQRGGKIAKGDVAEEYIMNNILFGLYGTVGQERMKNYSETLTIDKYKSSDNTSLLLNANIKKIDYTFTLHAKVGYDFGIFAPFVSAGVNFGDFFNKYYGFEFRLATDIKIPLYYDVVSFVFLPYFGVQYNNITVGTIGGVNKQYNVEGKTVKSGDHVFASEVALGFGALGGIRVGITDSISLTAMAGYRFFFNPVYRKMYVKGSEEAEIKGIPSAIKTLNLTGLEYMISFNMLF